jgi:tripartite-type tricarboxylate transporter receptor subunit TctC
MKTKKWTFPILIILCLWTSPLLAADFPAGGPVNLMFGYAPGGVADLQVRTIAAATEPYLGQTITVSNKVGAAGSIMMGMLAKSKPDGYTLGFIPGSLTLTPHFQTVPYELTDFTYLVGLSTFLESLNVLYDSPWKTLKDLTDYAKQNPGKVRVGTSAMNSSATFFATSLFKHAEAPFIVVPFGSVGEVNTALLGGHIEAGLDLGGVLPYMRAKKIRILVTATAERLKEFPDVPTARDLGVDFIAMSYVGIVGPKGLPEPITNKLIEAFKKGREDKKFVEFIQNNVQIPRYEMGKDFEKIILDNYIKTGKEYKK